MRIPENYVYHCVTCGRIEQHESATAEILCCGQQMSVTCTEKQCSCNQEDAGGTAEVSPPSPGDDGLSAPRQQELNLEES